MAKKRTKVDKAQRQADQLEKKASRRPPQNQKKKAPGENFNEATKMTFGGEWHRAECPHG
jgi:hypothetical protein